MSLLNLATLRRLHTVQQRLMTVAKANMQEEKNYELKNQQLRPGGNLRHRGSRRSGVCAYERFCTSFCIAWACFAKADALFS